MKFSDLTNTELVAQFIGLDFNVFDDFLKCGWNLKKIDATTRTQLLFDIIPEKYLVEELLIPKKSNPKTFRHVMKVWDGQLSNALKQLHYRLNAIKINDSIHGYVSGKSIRSNAREHLGMRFVLRFDIKDFFDSISQEDITNVFQRIGVPYEQSSSLSILTTINNHLAQGFPTSPTLSNIICDEMDSELEGLASIYNGKYTRYSDDCYISSNESLPSKNQIKDVFNKWGFNLNESKWSVMKRGQKQFVTGLSIYDENHPRLSKKIKNQIRFNYYHYSKDTDVIKGPLYDYILHPKVLKGWLSYAHFIEPWFIKKLLLKYGVLDI